MKFYLSLIITFILILCFGFFIIGSLTQSAENITNNFAEISDAINEEDWPKAEEQFTSVKEEWTQYKKWWAMIIDHHEIDNIDISFSRVDEYINHQNPALAAGELSVLEQYLKHIPETEKISWKNIF
ncbi:MAG: DUF4363 family protein [Dehalobacterium sp.]